MGGRGFDTLKFEWARPGSLKGVNLAFCSAASLRRFLDEVYAPGQDLMLVAPYVEFPYQAFFCGGPVKIIFKGWHKDQ